MNVSINISTASYEYIYVKIICHSYLGNGIRLCKNQKLCVATYGPKTLMDSDSLFFLLYCYPK